MSLYLDTSCLLKLVLIEPDSEQVQELVHAEPAVVVSTLAEFEAEQQLWSQRLGGTLGRREYASLRKVLEELRGLPPFEHKTTPGDLAQIARIQVREGSAYCRPLDRLHLAAMEALGVNRLLTNDAQQAAAARALGYGVVLPR